MIIYEDMDYDEEDLLTYSIAPPTHTRQIETPNLVPPPYEIPPCRR
jgi:hypothetical protein